MIPDRTYLVNLARRPDKLERALSACNRAGLSPHGVERWPAVEGSKLQHPATWKAGPGAWGCFLSHLRIWETAISEGLETICVLEDDVCWRQDGWTRACAWLDTLPEDWDLAYLGGQHLKDPHRKGENLLQGININRTHAYVARVRSLPSLHSHLMAMIAGTARRRPRWHIDHMIGSWVETRRGVAYAPEWWFAGQDEVSSDITGAGCRVRYWDPTIHLGNTPFVVPGSPEDAVKCRDLGVHFGYHLDEACTDTGLDKCLTTTGVDERELGTWLHMIAREALVAGTLPGIYHPEIGIEDVRWSGGTTPDPMDHEARLPWGDRIGTH